MKIWNFADSREEDEAILSKSTQWPDNVYGFGHLAYLRDVVDSITYNKKALVDGIEGRRSLELISAIKLFEIC